jgi:hypothetical protein
MGAISMKIIYKKDPNIQELFFEFQDCHFTIVPSSDDEELLLCDWYIGDIDSFCPDDWEYIEELVRAVFRMSVAQDFRGIKVTFHKPYDRFISL